jgi:hypothetical protein
MQQGPPTRALFAAIGPRTPLPARPQPAQPAQTEPICVRSRSNRWTMPRRNPMHTAAARDSPRGRRDDPGGDISAAG